MMGHLFYKVLLSRYTGWKDMVLADSRAASEAMSFAIDWGEPSPRC